LRTKNGITFHSFRHTFATRMAAAGAPLRALQEWLGHRDPKPTEVYRDYAPDPTGAAALIQRAFAAAGTNSGTNLSASESKMEQVNRPSTRNPYYAHPPAPSSYPEGRGFESPPRYLRSPC
jgi:hypothetical protein